MFDIARITNGIAGRRRFIGSVQGERDRRCRTVVVMLRIEWFEGSRAALADLFALADDSPTTVLSYEDLGRVLVARDGSTVIGHLQLIDGGLRGRGGGQEPCGS